MGSSFGALRIPAHVAITRFGLTLIPLNESHYPELALMLENESLWRGGFGGGIDDKPRTYEGLLNFVKTFVAHPEHISYAIFNKENVLVGTTSILEFEEDEERCTLGRTFLGFEHWGKGYSRTSKDILIDMLFSHGWRSVSAFIDSRNTESLSSVQKIGFVHTRNSYRPQYDKDGTPKEIRLYEVWPHSWVRSPLSVDEPAKRDVNAGVE